MKPQLDSLTAQRSAVLRASIAQLEIVGGPNGLTQLLANEPDADAKRRELISAIRGGRHVELAAPAITFRQRDGSPNSNYLRHKPSTLAAVAASYKGKPLLVDHNKWAQRARIGTISDSSLVAGADGWSGFRQTLHVVKPDAVISVLDGTLDRFSIGWRPTGAVICTLHNVDKLGPDRCSCWPGDHKTVDGKKVYAEFEYQGALGVETSAVNAPAVDGTHIQDVRAILAAELGIASPPIGERSSETVLAAAAAQLGLDPGELAATAERLQLQVLAGDDQADDFETALASAAAQLGVDVKDLEATVERLR